MMKKETNQEEKKKEQPKVIALPNSFNNVESCRIGELSMTSEVLRADQLLSMLLGALKNQDVKKYLDVIKKKKQSMYTG